MKKTALWVIILIVLVNLPPIKWLTGEDLLYSNATGTFTFDEVNYKGRNFELCMVNWYAFKSSVKKDTTLYRVTTINVLKFWHWADYLFKEKYRLPYKSWTEIDNIRGPIRNKTGWQNF